MKLAAPAILLLSATAAAHAQHLRLMQPPTGFALGMSDDGQCIFGVGVYEPPWRWTAHAGIEYFPVLPTFDFSRPYAASASGDVLVGMTAFSGYSTQHPARWTLEEVVRIPTSFDSIAKAVSADGQIATGYSIGEPFRWVTSEPYIEPLGLAAGWSSADATAITADGTAIVGFARAGTQRILFRWTQAGYESLASVSAQTAEARAVSADGQVVACSIDDRMYRWSPATGLVDLGGLPGATSTAPIDMDATGSLIVGFSSGGPPYAIAWTPATGIIALVDHLAAHGLVLSGVSLAYPIGVSSDGLSFAGYLPSSPGQPTLVWIAVLPGGNCYANCDQSSTPPALNIADFACFLQKFAAGDSYANCDQSTTPPTHTMADFSCFLGRFAAGCP